MAKKTTILLNTLEKIGLGFCVITGTICVIGGTLAVSAFSMYGMLLLSKTLWLVLAAGGASGFIECDIFIQTFLNSMRNLFIPRHFKLQLCQKQDENNELAKHQNENNELAKHQKVLATLAEQIEWLKKNKDKDFATYEAKLKTAKQWQYWLQKTLVPLEKNWLQVCLKGKYASTIKTKIILYYVGLALSVCTGLAAGLAVASSLKTSLVYLLTHFGVALSATALSATVFGLAAAAGGMYVFWTFSNICDMLQDAEFKQNCLYFMAKFKRREGEHWLRHVGRCILLGALGLLLIGGNAIAIAATAGTWCRLIKHGAEIIPWLKKAASTVRDILVAITILPNFISALVNGTESVTEFLKISPGRLKKQIEEDRENHRKKENLAQRYNPLRAIIFFVSLPIKIAAFFAHVVSMGTTANHVKGIKPRFTTAAVAANEVLQDGHRIFEHDDAADPEHENGEQAEHDYEHHENDEQAEHDYEHHENDEQAEHAHAHEHFDLIGNALKLVLSPLYLLSAALDCALSQANTKNKKPILSLKAACIKSFLGLKTLQQEPNISFKDGVKKFFGFEVKKISDQEIPLSNFAELQPHREKKIKTKLDDTLKPTINQLKNEDDKKQLTDAIIKKDEQIKTPFWQQTQRPVLQSFAARKIADQLDRLHFKTLCL